MPQGAGAALAALALDPVNDRRHRDVSAGHVRQLAGLLAAGLLAAGLLAAGPLCCAASSLLSVVRLTAADCWVHAAAAGALQAQVLAWAAANDNHSVTVLQRQLFSELVNYARRSAQVELPGTWVWTVLTVV